jgi:hypothetical protein
MKVQMNSIQFLAQHIDMMALQWTLQYNIAGYEFKLKKNSIATEHVSHIHC